MRVVVALGGNALLERDERPDAVIQRRHVRQAAAALSPLAGDHQLVLCHGNGPQVGMLALESQADTSLSRPYPLDVLVAQTQGMIGYWLVQELENVRALADAGVLVVCGGGGGVPVARSGAGELTGVEAVVDKDLTAAELAITLKADRLLVLTGVPAIIRGYGTPDARPIRAIDTVALSAMTFPAGSMGPKVEACIRFVRASGQPAAIGALTDAAEILAGRAGTTISAARPSVTE